MAFLPCCFAKIYKKSKFLHFYIAMWEKLCYNAGSMEDRMEQVERPAPLVCRDPTQKFAKRGTHYGKRKGHRANGARGHLARG
jgi:hypothetical protein